MVGYPVHGNTTRLVRIAEVAALSAVIGLVNAWFFAGDPGFLSTTFNPYTFAALFVAVYYGKHAGFLSIVVSAAAAAAGMLIRGLAPVPGMAAAAAAAAMITLVECYLLGAVRDSLTRKGDKAAARLAALTRSMGLLKRQVRALDAVNRELEQRLSRQRDNVTALYTQVQALNSLNLSKAFHAILEMVQRFVGATRCSLWEHRPESRSLVLAASVGGEQGAGPSTLPDDTSIEGWVVRNNSMFSVRMLQTNDALARLDTGRTIMTLPITAGRRIWGALSIEDMPFEKYNLYAERLLQVIMALTRPMLERGIEFDSIVRQEDIHPVTGLPSFPQFYAMLELEIARLRDEKGTLAVVIVEIANFAALAEKAGRAEAFVAAGRLAVLARESAAGPVWIFHYKADEQLAVLCPSLDADGASLFSLGLLGRVNEEEWTVAGSRVVADVVVGFAARSGSQGADELMEAAENLLQMQKV
jgi:GGDEF domain-containing protein